MICLQINNPGVDYLFRLFFYILYFGVVWYTKYANEVPGRSSHEVRKDIVCYGRYKLQNGNCTLLPIETKVFVNKLE